MNDSQPPNFRTRDRLNSLTHPLPCRFLEWTGWYNQSLHNRLIGHHRLYQLYQNASDESKQHDLPALQAYILRYRSTYTAKQLITKSASLLCSPLTTIASLNHHLINHRPDILQQFLSAAETDLDSALEQAHQAIHDPSFLYPPVLHNSPIGK